MNQKRLRAYTFSAEWITFAIAAFLVLILVGLVLFVWLTQSDEPPILSVHPQTVVERSQGQYYVPFTTANVGGGIAESVQVLGELIINGQMEEMGEQQIDFLSAGEEQQGAFVFSHDPRQGELIIRVASYKLP
ncbi:TIGR02588 family protein [Egbenema bharatensis]|uniref:TIGR02588 family protein n=1 Tax=Egbenema bharatensis TaxID=3463334 RepID=UPI003A84811D